MKVTFALVLAFSISLLSWVREYRVLSRVDCGRIKLAAAALFGLVDDAGRAGIW